MKRSQTATEYLIILAVVIVISLITIGVLGGVPSMGGGSSKNAKMAEIKNDKIGVDAFYIDGSYGLLKIKNNDEATIQISEVTIDEFSCSSSDLPISLKMGQTKEIECLGYYTDHSAGRTVPKVGFKYKNIGNGAEYKMGTYVEPTYSNFSLDLVRLNNYGGAEGHDQNWGILPSGNYLIINGVSYSDLSGLPGGSTNNGSGDFLISKIDKDDLHIEKINYFGGSQWDIISEIIEEKDYFVFGGYSKSNLTHLSGGSLTTGGADWIIGKLNKDTLDLIEIKNYGGILDDDLYFIYKDEDYYIGIGSSESDLSSLPGGSTNSGNEDFVIVKFDKNLNIVKVNNFGGTDVDVFKELIEYGNYYIIVGYSKSDLSSLNGGSTNSGEEDFVIGKIDKKTLDLVEIKNYGGTLEDTYNNIIDSNEYFIITGASYSDLSSFPGGRTCHGRWDGVILKIYKNNLSIYDMDYFGGTNGDQFGGVVEQDGYFYIAGSTQSDLRSYPGGSDASADEFLLVKYNASTLDVVEVNVFGGTGTNSFNIMYSPTIYDNYLYTTGFTMSDFDGYPGGSLKIGECDSVVMKFE